MERFRLRMSWMVYTVLVAFGVFWALSVSPPAAAAASTQKSEIEQLKEQLRENQLEQQKLQQQYDQMAREVEALSQNLKKVKVEAKKAAKPSQWVLKGTTIQTRDKTTRIHFGSYMQVDGAGASSVGNSLDAKGYPHVGDTGAVQFRRLRLYTAGVLYGVFPFKFEWDFASTKTDPVASGIKDAYVGYSGLNFCLFGENTKTLFLFGNQYPAFGNHVPSAWREFMEDSLDYYTFEPSRAVGADFFFWQKHWNLWAGVATPESPGTDSPPSMNQNGEYGGWTGSGVFSVMPINDPQTCEFLLVQGSFAYHSTTNGFGDSHFDSYSNTPDFHLFGTKLINTGTLSAHDSHLYAGDVMAEYGPFDVRAHYYYANVVGSKANQGQSADFSGWAAQMGYFLTPGDHRGWSEGPHAGFTGVHPVDPVVFNKTPGCWWGFSGMGAWQIALQGDHVDLNDGLIYGGRETDISAALDWYLNYNLRVIWQVTDVLSVNGGKYNGITPIIYGMRMQYKF